MIFGPLVWFLVSHIWVLVFSLVVFHCLLSLDCPAFCLVWFHATLCVGSFLVIMFVLVLGIRCISSAFFAGSHVRKGVLLYPASYSGVCSSDGSLACPPLRLLLGVPKLYHLLCPSTQGGSTLLCYDHALSTSCYNL